MPNPTDQVQTPFHVVMLSFEGVDAAGSVLQKVKSEGLLEGCEIEAQATVARHADGRVELHERGAAGIGAALGVVTAGILGVVTGPVFLLLIVAVGGVVGGIAGHFAGQILPPDELREIADSLPSGSSAILAVVDSPHADCVVAAFEAEGAKVVDVPVETEISSVLREGITHRVTRV